MKKIKPEVKAGFLSRDVPSDCDVQFCNERIALWTYFRQELEKRFEAQKFNSETGGSVHDGSWAEKLMNLTKSKGSRGPSANSQSKQNSVKDASDHVSELIAKMGGLAASQAERESRASRNNSEHADANGGMMTSPVSRTSLASIGYRRDSQASEHRSRVESTMDPILEGR